MRNALLASTAVTAAILLQFGVAAPALAQSTAALAGKVSSAGEPVMEGVVVSAKKDGSTITVSVVTDDKGQYSFPAPGITRLAPAPSAMTLTAPKLLTSRRGRRRPPTSSSSLPVTSPPSSPMPNG